MTNPFLAALLVLPIAATAATPDRDGAPSIRAVGEGRAVRKADVAYVTLYVRGQGMLMADALKRADEQTKAIRDALKDGVKEVRLFESSPAGLRSFKEDVWRSDQKSTPKPEAVVRIRLTLPPTPAVVVAALDLALRNGAEISKPTETRFAGQFDTAVQYGLLNFTEAEAEARRAAFLDAEKRARAVAAAAGVTVKGILGVEAASCQGSRFWQDSHEDELPTRYVSDSPDDVVVRKTFDIRFSLGS